MPYLSFEQSDDPTRFADMVDPKRDVIQRFAILGFSIPEDVRAMLPEPRYETGVIVAARTQGNSGSSSGPPAGRCDLCGERQTCRQRGRAAHGS